MKIYMLRFFLILLVLFPFAAEAASASVYLEDLTSPEVKKFLSESRTTVIIPTGGTEQNGPHMVLGKHNYIVYDAAGSIAEQLGNALVAPVMAYVPEGAITPPEGHMRFAGTISLPDEVYEQVLEYAARSLKQHGFKLICFLGDSGPNQAPQELVAARLSNEWKNDGVRVLQVGDYYNHAIQDQFLLTQGLSKTMVGTHAGIEDTSELLATHPSGVRRDLLAAHGDADYDTAGATGDSTKASLSLGKKLLRLRIDAAVKQIRAFAAVK